MTVAAVIIGRNEGKRLISCLESLAGQALRLIYVDSGSTDGSVLAAQALGAEVVVLDMTRPFTAARARNAGIDRLRNGGDLPSYIQFVDGDCEVQPGWIETATTFLDAQPKAAVACGRNRERHPDRSIYNLLCDHEWNTPVGETKACGGIALIRTEALVAIGGYREDVIAAEDDELCQRLRKAGWQIWRIDAEMTLHDAALTRFGPWWRRMMRAGHAFAQVEGLHPGHFSAQIRRALFWALATPIAVLVGFLWWWPLSVSSLLLYPLSWIRLARRLRREGLGQRAEAAAALMLASKFANLQGIALWHWRRIRGHAATIIEYK